MKIIFMGTPDFAVGTLRSLAEAGHEITLVVSQPDKPKGRGHAMVPTPVKAVAEELGIPVFQPVKTLQQNFLGFTVSYISNDSTHKNTSKFT